MNRTEHTWRRQARPVDGDFDRPRALENVQITLALVAATLGFVSWLLRGFAPRGDPIVPVSLAAAVLLACAAWATRRVSLELRIVIFHMLTVGLVGTYIGLRYVSGDPLSTAAYIAVPVLAALVFSRQTGALVTIGCAALWTTAAAAGKWVTPGVDDLFTTGAILAFAVPVAVLLEWERERAERWSRHWRAEHDAMDSLLRSSDDCIFSVNRAGELEFANAAGLTWCEKVADSSMEVPWFWRQLPLNSRTEFEQCFLNAVRGRPRRLEFEADMHDERRIWEASFAPHIRGGSVMLTIRDITTRRAQEHAAFLDAPSMHPRPPVSHDPKTPLAPKPRQVPHTTATSSNNASAAP